jgi:cbb3-type cytochrome oxidase cytochrome c subunit
MKGILPIFLGIFGTFAFSWLGLTVIPNAQIGHLDPQMDEEGTDVYPAPKSGMADRGRHVYAANGCVYCHSQQVRADYAASDIDRKWGDRRSAPRDYIFERPVQLGKMRMGPDLANIGKRAPVDDENAPAPGSAPAAAVPAPGARAGAAPSPAAAAPATAAHPANPPAAGGASPPPPAPASGTANAGTQVASNSPAPPPAAASPAAASPAPAAAAQTAGTLPTETFEALAATGKGELPYSAAWHHRHLYAPRSVSVDSIMPAYRFLYEKRRINGERAADALQLSGSGAPAEGWEIVPSYDAKCLVAYLMSLDQSHPLAEVRSTAPASPPAPGKAVK